jgi:lipopolysaccharide transport system ATP-binding protein
MSETVIRVENLSKKYLLDHQQEGHRNYKSIKESLPNAISSLGKKILNPRGEKGLKSSQEEFWALKDVSFEIKQGDRVGIIGRNGAGKSTLLKILSRITEPTNGRIGINGRIASLLEVGTGFHPELTGRENIFLNGAVLGMSQVEIKRKFDEIVDFAEVEKFLDTPVKRYSSGMYVRLAFAVAAHLEPEILIVDEVLAVGDTSFQKKCIGKMEMVSSEGRTVLFVSHNVAAVRRLCNRAIFLEKGTLQEEGIVDSVLKTYIEGGSNAQFAYNINPPKEKDVPGYAHKLIIEDKFGDPASSIPVGQPWQVRVHFTIENRVEHFVMGLGLKTSDEVPLRTSWSKPYRLEPGEYQMTFRENTVILGTDRYTLIVGLSEKTRTFHYVENAGTIEIAEFSEGLDLIATANVGSILNVMDIELVDSVRELSAVD